MEIDFLKFFDSFYEDLSKKYKDVALVRNEQFWPIFNFSDGQAFYPDFVLFLRKNGGKKIDAMQIFIEPKGEVYAKAELWKQELLLDLKKQSKIKIEWKNEHYNIIGLPFFNEELRQEFEKSFSEQLLN